MIASGAGLAIVAISIGIIRNDSPANGAADKAAVTSKSMMPTWTPISPRMPRKAVEQAPPPVIGSMPGDGAWVVGRDLKQGTYRTEGGRSCRWMRLQGSPGAPWSVASSPSEFGPQIVVLGRDDVLFASQDCPEWTRIR